MPDVKLTLHLADMPDVLFDIRRRFAAMLRREAAVEAHPFTKRRLLALAADWEVGLEGATPREESEC
jgi:hypothetical protein